MLAARARSRQTKWASYEQAFPPVPGERVLDVGASSLDDLPEENYFLRKYPYPGQLTAVGVDELTDLRERYPEVTFVQADGRRMPFADQSFDVVHSNAVIEHVGPRREQELFVAELVRVGRSGFVTTPNRWFPIETHSNLPLLHWLPRPAVDWLVETLHEPDLGWWLLGARRFERLFTANVVTVMYRTRILGLSATLIVTYRPR